MHELREHQWVQSEVDRESWIVDRGSLLFDPRFTNHTFRSKAAGPLDCAQGRPLAPRQGGN